MISKSSLSRMEILSLSFSGTCQQIHMKTITTFFFLAAFFSLLAIGACKKSGGATEEDLSVETTPTTLNNHVEPPLPGPNFTLNVKIKSKMPPNGVNIAVSARPENSATAFFNQTITTSSTDNNFTITNSPGSVTCIVDITVTSVSKASNKWTGSYRYSRK
jgi:hypothetical protein